MTDLGILQQLDIIASPRCEDVLVLGGAVFPFDL